MKKISPHDQFFKELFSRKDHVADLIRYTLPVDIAKALDLQTLNLENASFVDDDLNQHFSDLVYTCSSKDNMIKICLLSKMNCLIWLQLKWDCLSSNTFSSPRNSNKSCSSFSKSDGPTLTIIKVSNFWKLY